MYETGKHLILKRVEKKFVGNAVQMDEKIGRNCGLMGGSNTWHALQAIKAIHNKSRLLMI